jgi:hypothetical protein
VGSCAALVRTAVLFAIRRSASRRRATRSGESLALRWTNSFWDSRSGRRGSEVVVLTRIVGIRAVVPGSPPRRRGGYRSGGGRCTCSNSSPCPRSSPRAKTRTREWAAAETAVETVQRRRRAPGVVGSRVGSVRKTPLAVRPNRRAPPLFNVQVVGSVFRLDAAANVAEAAPRVVGVEVRDGRTLRRELVDSSAGRPVVAVRRGSRHPVGCGQRPER